MAKEQFKFEFVPNGKGKATEPPNPDFPNGISINLVKPGIPYCETEIPYPAPECGMYKITCKICDYTCAITSVGRPDDPIHLKFPCLFKSRSN